MRPNALFEDLTGLSHDAIIRDGQIYLPMGDAKVSYLAARDVGAVCAESMVSTGHWNKLYTLTGSGAIPVEEIAVALGRALGSGVTYIDVTEEMARQQMIAGGKPQWFGGYPVGIVRLLPHRQGPARHRGCQRVTGLAPMDIWTWADLHKGEFRQAA